ncbi:MAG: DivIVA domain-containing protein [Microlunatus sp.]|nr:DivIVA domain-containing protein [Microlunatus sp.]
MTLSLDDVRNKRFRMARKSGYEVLEVDEFVDEVEVAVEQLTEENQNLKKQVEVLRTTSDTSQGTPASAAQTPAETETIVVTTGAEASTAVVRLVALSTEQAEYLVDEATADARRIRAEATDSAELLTSDAQARAERIESEAQEFAERVRSEAQTKADNLDGETAARRDELLGSLSAERDQLQEAVSQLRGFEEAYRANLTNELREHISTLESRQAQPDKVPALATDDVLALDRAADDQSSDPAPNNDAESVASAGEEDGSAGEDESIFPTDDTDTEDNPPTSETPRLDALLGSEQR